MWSLFIYFLRYQGSIISFEWVSKHEKSFGEKSVWFVLCSDFGIKCVRLTACGEVGYGVATEKNHG